MLKNEFQALVQLPKTRNEGLFGGGEQLGWDNFHDIPYKTWKDKGVKKIFVKGSREIARKPTKQRIRSLLSSPQTEKKLNGILLPGYNRRSKAKYSIFVKISEGGIEAPSKDQRIEKKGEQQYASRRKASSQKIHPWGTLVCEYF